MTQENGERPAEVLIPLTKGKVARIDAQDLDKVSSFKWRAHKSGTSDYWRAVTTVSRSAGYKYRKNITMQSLIFGPVTPGMEIDHVDGDSLNNTRANLREATRQQQSFNRGPLKRSKFKGVKLNKPGRRKRFRSEIKSRGKTVYLGAFNTQEEAARAYDRAAREFYGEFARLNFPDR
jgi:hypothetical protein